jgi:hypothetical protein
MIVYLDKYLNIIWINQIYFQLKGRSLIKDVPDHRRIQRKYAVNILQFSLTLNNNRINDSLSVFWHNGTCFE